MRDRLTDREIARLVVYRRLLEQLRADRVEYVFSHTLAGLAGVTAAQVRRDVMDVNYLGNPAKGYRVAELLERISAVLDPPSAQGAVLAGAGRLGGALLSYFTHWSQRLKIVGVFDNAPSKIGRNIHGQPCRRLEDLPKLVLENHVDLGIIAVPADAAPGVCRMMIEAGIRGILNFAPVTLEVPPTVYVEQVDLTISIERVAYMARLSGRHATAPQPASEVLAPGGAMQN